MINQYQTLQGPRVEFRQCLVSKCPGTTSNLMSYYTTPPTPRPTPVYGASPCACGCTYILHSNSEQHNHSRHINIVSGVCPGLPVSWTVKVPDNHEILLSLANISFSCPSLYMNIRDGVHPTDIVLYQVMDSTNNSVKVKASNNILRLELEEDFHGTNLSHCYVVLHMVVHHGGKN